MASCLPSAHLTKEEQSGFALFSASTMLGAEASMSEVVSVGRHVNVGDRAVRHKVVEEGWGEDGSLF